MSSIYNNFTSTGKTLTNDLNNPNDIFKKYLKADQGIFATSASGADRQDILQAIEKLNLNPEEARLILNYIEKIELPSTRSMRRDLLINIADSLIKLGKDHRSLTFFHVGKTTAYQVAIEYLKSLTKLAYQNQDKKFCRNGYGGFSLFAKSQYEMNIHVKSKNLSNLILLNTNFERSILESANLTNSNFYNSNFNNVNLTNADLTKAYFGEANFTNAVLQNVKISGAGFNDVNFDGVTNFAIKFSNNLQDDLMDKDYNILKAIDSIDSKYITLKTNLIGQVIDYLKDKDITSILPLLQHYLLNTGDKYLNNDKIKGFIIAKLSDANLLSEELKKPHWSNFDIHKKILDSKSNNRNVYGFNSRLPDNLVNLHFADLKNKFFTNINFSNINFYGADFNGSKFEKVKIHGANFKNANFDNIETMTLNLENINEARKTLSSINSIDDKYKDLKIQLVSQLVDFVKSAKLNTSTCIFNKEIFLDNFIELFLDNPIYRTNENINTYFINWMKEINYQDTYDRIIKRIIKAINSFAEEDKNLKIKIISLLIQKDNLKNETKEYLTRLLLDNPIYHTNIEIKQFLIAHLEETVVQTADKLKWEKPSETVLSLLLDEVNSKDTDYYIRHNNFFIQLVYYGFNSTNQASRDLAKELYNKYLNLDNIKKVKESLTSCEWWEDDYITEDKLNPDYKLIFYSPDNKQFLAVSLEYMDNFYAGKITNWGEYFAYELTDQNEIKNNNQQLNLNKMVDIFSIFKADYLFAQSSKSFVKLIKILNLPDEMKQHFINAQKNKIYSTKMVEHEVQIELSAHFNKIFVQKNGLIEYFKSFFWKDSPTQVSLNNEIYKSIIETFEIDDKDNTTKAKTLLVLSAAFMYYSSRDIFGTEDESPYAIRQFAYVLMKKAYELDSNIFLITEDDSQNSTDMYQTWTNKLLGLKSQFSCTAQLSDEIYSKCDKTIKEKIWPTAWQ